MKARRVVSRLQRRIKKGWAVLALDECHAKLFPTRAPMWAKKGVWPEIPLLDRHGKCAVFGAADVNSGRMIHHLAKSLSGTEQIELLNGILSAYPEGRILLLWDNGPTHRNKKVTEWLKEHSRVSCFWLPPYSGADVNPIEHCWKWFRENVTHNHLFTQIEELFKATNRFFEEVACDRKAVLARLGQM